MRHRRAQVTGRPRGGHAGPVGARTRGTTAANRLRRADRWMLARPAIRLPLRAADDPLVVDLGYGARPVTTLEWARRLRTVRPDVRVVGLEIDPERVVPPVDGVEFAVGGFELAGLRPVVVRAFNVLRQYPEDEVRHLWAVTAARLAPGGVLIDGTCDETGRHCAWVEVAADGPRTLTLCWSPRHVGRPSELAERLPKALIHRNVPGERVHGLLAEADRAWDAAAPLAPYGPRARWRAAAGLLRGWGVPLERTRPAARDAVLTVPWGYVRPADGPGADALNSASAPRPGHG